MLHTYLMFFNYVLPSLLILYNPLYYGKICIFIRKLCYHEQIEVLYKKIDNFQQSKKTISSLRQVSSAQTVIDIPRVAIIFGSLNKRGFSL